jgi:hypothetical protein
MAAKRRKPADEPGIVELVDRAAQSATNEQLLGAHLALCFALGERSEKITDLLLGSEEPAPIAALQDALRFVKAAEDQLGRIGGCTLPYWCAAYDAEKELSEALLTAAVDA